jgi:hypothetical protein
LVPFYFGTGHAFVVRFKTKTKTKNTRKMPTTTDLSTLNTRAQKVDADYTGVAVAWNDGQRGVASFNGAPQLSSIGNNITDVRLIAKDGGVLPFVRPHNHDEIIGITTADKVMFVEKDGSQTTAQEILETMTDRAGYMGYVSVDAKPDPREKVIVRVQNVWVPLNADETERQVAPGHYSYQTKDPANPRNLIVLGTPSGVFVHSDAAGIKKLMAHSNDPDGSVNEHWHSVEPTNTRVGETQKNETPVPAKRARAVEMGLHGMGHRSNCFLVMSIPNKQKLQSVTRSWADYEDDDDDDSGLMYRSMSGGVLRSLGAVDGVSRVARVSVDEAIFGKATKNEIAIVRPGEGNNKEPIVITIMLYHTVQANAGVVNVAEEDVVRGINDIKSIYKMCDVTCKLSELPKMLHKLTPQDVKTCVEKVAKDPVSKDPFVPQSNALSMFG